MPSLEAIQRVEAALLDAEQGVRALFAEVPVPSHWDPQSRWSSFPELGGDLLNRARLAARAFYPPFVRLIAWVQASPMFSDLDVAALQPATRSSYAPRPRHLPPSDLESRLLTARAAGRVPHQQPHVTIRRRPR